MLWLPEGLRGDRNGQNPLSGVRLLRLPTIGTTAETLPVAPHRRTQPHDRPQSSAHNRTERPHERGKAMELPGIGELKQWVSGLIAKAKLDAQIELTQLFIAALQRQLSDLQKKREELG